MEQKYFLLQILDIYFLIGVTTSGKKSRNTFFLSVGTKCLNFFFLGQELNTGTHL